MAFLRSTMYSIAGTFQIVSFDRKRYTGTENELILLYRQLAENPPVHRFMDFSIQKYCGHLSNCVVRQKTVCRVRKRYLPVWFVRREELIYFHIPSTDGKSTGMPFYGIFLEVSRRSFKCVIRRQTVYQDRNDISPVWLRRAELISFPIQSTDGKFTGIPFNWFFREMLRARFDCVLRHKTVYLDINVISTGLLRFKKLISFRLQVTGVNPTVYRFTGLFFS